MPKTRFRYRIHNGVRRISSGASRAGVRRWLPRCATLVVLPFILATAGCPSGNDEPSPPELPFSFGPTGHGERACAAPPPPPAPQPLLPAGCVVRFVIRPGVAELGIRVFNMPAVGHVHAFGCRSSSTCPAVAIAQRSTDPPDSDGAVTYTANVPLTSATATGINRFCANANIVVIGGSGAPPGPPNMSLPLECLNLDGSLLAAAGAFRMTEERDGLHLQGWAIDETTNNAGAFTIRNGSDAGDPQAATMAGGAEPRSRPAWPGFSELHGFNVVVGYRGRPGTSPLCVVLAAMTIHCFSRAERTQGFGPAQNIVQGGTIPVGLRNVGAGTKVTVDFQSDGGYFLMPWTHSAVWTATAGTNGAVDLNVDSSYFPPARYTIAFHCQPDCPGGTLPAGDLVGGPQWTGTIHLGQSFSVVPQGSATLTTVAPDPEALRVTGAGFSPNQPLRLVVVPNVGLFDGPPVEAAPVAYPVADQAGTFTAEVVVAGLPLDGRNTQVIAFAEDGRPAAATVYSR
jgi:hypothetical protein